MKSSHAASWLSASFSDPNLLASAGLVPLMRLAERCDLPAPIRRHVDLGVTTGVNPAGKAMTLVAGMCVGADSIEDIVYLDIDSKVKQVYGPAKQGASFGYTKVCGLHFQIVTASTASSRPVVIATRLRKGSAGSGKGAHPQAADATGARWDWGGRVTHRKVPDADRTQTGERPGNGD